MNVGESWWEDFDPHADTAVMLRHVRAVAAAAGVDPGHVSAVDAFAGIVGARLWCATYRRTALSDAAGLPAQAPAWAATVTMRACGVAEPGRDTAPATTLVKAPPDLSARLLNEMVAAHTWLERHTCQQVSVWTAVASDVLAADGNPGPTLEAVAAACTAFTTL